MNSPYIHIYESIATAIQNQFPHWHIDHDYGQLDITPRPPVTFPCVLIDFPSTAYEEQQAPTQIATTQISIRLAFAPFDNTSIDTPTAWRQQAMSYYEDEYNLNKLLHYLDVEIGQLVRLQSTTENRPEDTMRVRRIIYTITFGD